MKIALIQLSDIHLKEDASANPVLQRASAISRAVASVSYGISHGIIVLSGDTAFSGKEGEYRHARNLIEEIRSGLASSIPVPQIPVLTIAGNHDCNFALATTVRNIIIASLKPEQIDNAVIAQCTEVQRHYYSFANQLHQAALETSDSGLDRLYSYVRVPAADKVVVLHLLNSAWVSQLNEKPGTLFFPIALIKDRIASGPPADLVVAVVHHPFNWYWSENTRDFRLCLEENCDLILTGHEHVAGAYQKKTDTGEQNEYLEGGVLQESDQPDVSSFNVVLVDFGQGQQQTYRFVWRGDNYAADGDPYWRPFERNKRLTRNQFEFTDSFFEWLDDPGAGYTHPYKDPLHLSDFYVYPDLQEVQYQRDQADRPLVRSRDIVTYILKNRRVMILGEEKSGKTSLAKMLVQDLHNNGKVPVVIDGETLRKCLHTDKLKKAIDDRVADHYGTGHLDTYWQLSPDQRIVIVDDFHKVGGNQRSKDQIVRLLAERFEMVVLLAGEEFRFEEIASPSAASSCWRRIRMKTGKEGRKSKLITTEI